MNQYEYYEETIKASGYNVTPEVLMTMTVPFLYELSMDDFTPRQVDYATARASTPPSPYLIGWQFEPLLSIGMPLVNLNLLSAGLYDTFQTSYKTQLPSFDFNHRPIFGPDGSVTGFLTESQLFQPVYNKVLTRSRSSDSDPSHANEGEDGLEMVAATVLTLDWIEYFYNVLPEDVNGIDIVLQGKCSNEGLRVTYRLNGRDVVSLGTEDLHQVKYDDLGVTVPLATLDIDENMMRNSSGGDGEDICISEIIMSIYPTKEFEEAFYTKNAYWLSGAVAAIFVFTAFVFSIYDLSVKRRQNKVMARIIKQDRLVSSMFPEEIKNKLYAAETKKNNGGGGDGMLDGTNRVTDDDLDNPDLFGSGPLAELYPNSTIIFAGKLCC